MKTALEAKVIATNRANAEANRLYPLFVAALTPFLNKKVITIDGDLTKNVHEAIQAIPTTAFRIYRGNGRSGLLFWTVTECENYSYYSCVYAETTFYVGEMNVQELYNLQSFRAPNLPTNITADQIREARQCVIKAKSALSAAQSALGDFGEYDSNASQSNHYAKNSLSHKKVDVFFARVCELENAQ